MLKEKLIAYFRSGETLHEHFKVGAAFEHVIIKKGDMKTVPFRGPEGMESLLGELKEKGWQTYLNTSTGVEKEGTIITVEPGCKLKVSIKKTSDIKEIDRIYLEFLKDLFPLLEKRNQYMLAVGYHPASKIEEIEDSFDQRYQHVSQYLKDKGQYALNMLKGTVSTQVTLDYAHQDDFRKKIQVAYALSPVMTALFDNSPIFEGEVYKDGSLRRLIGNNSNDHRSQIPGIFKNAFGYADYAEFVMNSSPVFIKNGDEYIYTGDKTLAEIYQDKEIDEEGIENALSMVFSDLKLKKHLEITMADALPYPLNMAYITFWKTLIYNRENLNALYEFIHTIKEEDIIQANQDIIKEGLDAKLGNGTVRDLAKDLFFMAGSYCLPIEAHYLEPIEAVIFKEVSPREVTLRHLNEMK